MKKHLDYFYAQPEGSRTKQLNNEVAFTIREVEYEVTEDNKIDTFYAIGCNTWYGLKEGKEVEFCTDAEGIVTLPWKIDIDELVQEKFVHIPWKSQEIKNIDDTLSISDNKKFWLANIEKLYGVNAMLNNNNKKDKYVINQ